MNVAPNSCSSKKEFHGEVGISKVALFQGVLGRVWWKDDQIQWTSYLCWSLLNWSLFTKPLLWLVKFWSDGTYEKSHPPKVQKRILTGHFCILKIFTLTLVLVKREKRIFIPFFSREELFTGPAGAGKVCSLMLQMDQRPSAEDQKTTFFHRFFFCGENPWMAWRWHGYAAWCSHWIGWIFYLRPGIFFKYIFYIGLIFRDTPFFGLQSLWHKIKFDLVFLTPHLISAMLMLQVLGFKGLNPNHCAPNHRAPNHQAPNHQLTQVGCQFF